MSEHEEALRRAREAEAKLETANATIAALESDRDVLRLLADLAAANATVARVRRAGEIHVIRVTIDDVPMLYVRKAAIDAAIEGRDLWGPISEEENLLKDQQGLLSCREGLKRSALSTPALDPAEVERIEQEITRRRRSEES